MITCPKCNKEFNDDFKFCDSCGASLTEQTAREEVVEEEKTTEDLASDETNNEEQSLEMQQNDEQSGVGQSDKPTYDKKKFSLKPILFGLIAIAVIAVIIIGLKAILGGGKNTDGFALYIKDEEIYFKNVHKNKEPVEITDRLIEDSDIDSDEIADNSFEIGYATCFSSDGKYIFFPQKMNEDDDGITLYYREVSKPNKEAVKIDSDVLEYHITPDSKAVVYKSDSKIYRYDIKKDEKEKLISDVYEWWASEDFTDFIYLDDEDRLYLKLNNKDKEKITGDVSDIEYVTSDLKTVYYTKDDALYKQQIGKDKVKIASDVVEVLNIYNSGEIYYLTADNEEISLLDYVTDDMKEADENISYPDYPTYPDSPDSPSRPYYYSWYYDSYEEYEAEYEAWEKEYDAYLVAYDEWEAECDRLDEEYDAALDLYWSKDERDDIRSELESRTLNNQVYSLCYYDGKKETVLTESFADNINYYDSYDFDYSYSYNTPVITYVSYNQSEIDNVKLSDVTDVYDLEDKVLEALYSSHSRYVAVKDKATVVDIQDNATRFEINYDGTDIYYIDNISDDEMHGDIYHISVSNNSVSKSKKYDSDVYAGYASRFISNKEYLYFKDVKDGVGDLYINKKSVDTDVYIYNIPYTYDDNSILYYTDYDTENHTGTLNIYNGKKSTKISDDVYEFDTTPDGKVVYLYDYSTKRNEGDLLSWSNGKSKKIDDEVAAILSVTTDSGFAW